MLEGMPFRWLTIFLDFPGSSFDAGVAFWREVTGTALSPFRGAAGEFATLLPPDGDAYLRVQRVADGPGGHHLDLHVDSAAGTVDQATRAMDLGARMLYLSDGLVIADSPGGFTFCLVRWHGESQVPRPFSPGAAGPSRADQLCLDIPPEAFDRECAFWAGLTGWELQPGRRPEFARLDPPAGMPAGLLLQRRDRAGTHDRVTAHVDFACADREALAGRDAEAGARIVSEFPRWITMADPAGRLYCLTGREPAAGR